MTVVNALEECAQAHEGASRALRSFAICVQAPTADNVAAVAAFRELEAAHDKYVSVVKELQTQRLLELAHDLVRVMDEALEKGLHEQSCTVERCCCWLSRASAAVASAKGA